MKSDKMSHVIYAHIESLMKKINTYANNPENSSTTKFGEHIPYACSMSALWAFDNVENKHTLYCEKDCLKKFCTFIKRTRKI